MLRKVSGLYSNENEKMEAGYFKEYLLISKDGYAYFLLDSTDNRDHSMKKIKVNGDKARLKINGDSIWFNIDSTKAMQTITATVFGKNRKWINWIYYHNSRTHFSGKFTEVEIDFNEMDIIAKSETITSDGDKPSKECDTTFRTERFVHCVDSLQFPKLRK
jgi:hypothetical protein